MPSIRILSGKYKNRKLDFTIEKGLRPTAHRLRQAVFNTLIHRFFCHRIGQNSPLAGIKVLDLFAGLGAYGFEALSLGATHVTFVEKTFSTARLINGYAHQLDCLQQVQVQWKPWPCSLPAGDTFDVIFMDPPYNTNPSSLYVALEACIPWMKDSSVLILESPHLVRECLPCVTVFAKKMGDTYFTFFQKQ